MYSVTETNQVINWEGRQRGAPFDHQPTHGQAPLAARLFLSRY